jgi:histone-lysine N-methyltransferase SETD1
VTFSERSTKEEYNLLYQFLTHGLDLEDVRYFQISYQMMLKREEMSKLLNYTHWVDHPVSLSLIFGFLPKLETLAIKLY